MIPPRPTGTLRKWAVWKKQADGTKVLVLVQVRRCPLTQVVTKVAKEVPS